MNYKLSICIPTYNRANYLSATLESVISQSSNEVEIVVSDNASQDNTQEIVNNYKKKFQHITYFRWSQNMGADCNYLKVIELAKGEYCWFLGSDDLIKQGAIEQILKEIQLKCDIYLCNRTECDQFMTPIRDRLWLNKKIKDHIFNFSNRDDILYYLDVSEYIGALFSYISSIIFNRKKWEQASYDEVFTGTAYSHVYKLFGIIKNQGSLKYIYKPLVFCRGDNDSFLKNGTLNRFLIDINGYLLLSKYLFSFDNKIQASFLSVMRKEHRWFTLSKFRYHAKNKEQWIEIQKKLSLYGYSRSQLFLSNLLGSVIFLMLPLLFFRRAQKQISNFCFKLSRAWCENFKNRV